jgi:hypothetical protein
MFPIPSGWREAQQQVGSKYVDQVLDSLYVIEVAMRRFFSRHGSNCKLSWYLRASSAVRSEMYK